MDLRLCTYTLTDHAQKFMRELGITYRLAVAQSLGDQWWFFDCESVPDPLPEVLTVLNIEEKTEDLTKAKES